MSHSVFLPFFNLQMQESNRPGFGFPGVHVVPAWGVFTGWCLCLPLILLRVNFSGMLEWDGGVPKEEWQERETDLNCKCVGERGRERGGEAIYTSRGGWCSQTQLDCFTISPSGYFSKKKKGEFGIFALLSISIAALVFLCVVYYNIIGLWCIRGGKSSSLSV